MNRTEVQRAEPEVYALACQLQEYLQLTWAGAVIISRQILVNYRFLPRHALPPSA